MRTTLISLACVGVLGVCLASIADPVLAGTAVHGIGGTVSATDGTQGDVSSSSKPVVRTQSPFGPTEAAGPLPSPTRAEGTQPAVGTQTPGAPLDPSAAAVTSPGLPFTIGGQCINVTITYVAIPGGVPGCAGGGARPPPPPPPRPPRPPRPVAPGCPLPHRRHHHRRRPRSCSDGPRTPCCRRRASSWRLATR